MTKDESNRGISPTNKNASKYPISIYEHKRNNDVPANVASITAKKYRLTKAWTKQAGIAVIAKNAII